MNHGTLTKLAIATPLTSNDTQLLLEALPQSQLTSLSIMIMDAKDFIALAHVVTRTKLDFLRIPMYKPTFTIEPDDMQMAKEILQQSRLRTFVCRGFNEHGVYNRYNQMIVNSCTKTFM